MESEKFDLVFVTEKFKESLEHEEDVLLEFYLQAFREILKFVLILLLFEFTIMNNFKLLQILSTDGFNLWIRVFRC